MSEEQTPPVDVTVPDEATPPDDAPAIVKKPDLIQRILEKTGKKQAEVKPVMEATLAALSEALLAGENLQIQPLGRVKVNKVKATENGKVLTLRMRVNDPKPEA